MRALLTGATGYIGRHLAAALRDEQWEVHALVRLGSPNRPGSGAVSHEYDGTSACVDDVIGEVAPEMVFHLAASVSDDSPEQADRLIEANLAMGTQILRAVAKRGRVGFVNAASFSERATGTADYFPASLYAATKHAFENILFYYERAGLVSGCSLTIYDTYGPDDSRGKIFDLLDLAARDGSVVDMSLGEQLLHLVYIDDVVRGFLRAAELLRADPLKHCGSRFCLDAAEPLTLREAVATYSAVTGRGVHVNWGGREYRQFEIFRPWVGKRLPGWAPAVTLPEGLRRTFPIAADHPV